MKIRLLSIAALAGALAFTLVPEVADAKRFGGARSSGMQRQAPDKPPQNAPAATPNQNTAGPAAAATPAAAGTAAAAAGKRSWMGPVAGLAAGLGLAALFSHLGLGAELANFVMLALIVLAVIVVLRLLLARRNGTPALATAGGAARVEPPRAEPMQRSSWAPTGPAVMAPAAATALPAGFDTAGFERLAKMLFIRMQAANDRADLADLRNFTTPEMFAELRLDLQERGDAGQHTDVVQVNAELVDFEQEADGRQLVSVRYTGLVREAEQGADEPPTPFDEVWHLAKARDDERWVIAGIQQR